MDPCTYVVAVGIQVRTCDKGSIGGRTSCLRFASRPGLGPLLGEEVVLELVLLCCRPGDRSCRLDWGVSGLLLAEGIVSTS